MNALRQIADCYDAILKRNHSSADLLEDMHLILEATDFETSEIAASRVATQAATELRLYLEDEGDLAGMDIPRVFNLIWELPRTTRLIGQGKIFDPIDTIAPTALLGISILANQKSRLLSPQTDQEIAWISLELDEIEALMDESALPGNLKHVIERQIAKVRALLETPPVNSIALSQELTSLAGMLAAATIAEPDEEKKKRFGSSLGKIAGKLLADISSNVASGAIATGLAGFLQIVQ